MAIKIKDFGGESDWQDGDVLFAADQIDTFLATNDIFSEFEQKKLSVTTSSSNTTYSKEYFAHLIKNVGSNTCFISLTTATTNDIQLNPLESIYLEGYTDKIYAITSSGTTDLRIIGQK